MHCTVLAFTTSTLWAWTPPWAVSRMRAGAWRREETQAGWWTCSADTWLSKLDLPLLFAPKGRGDCPGLLSGHQKMGSGSFPSQCSQLGSLCLGNNLGWG